MSDRMRQSPTKPTAEDPRPPRLRALHIVGLVAAGVLSFAAAHLAQSRLIDEQASTGEVVQAATRHPTPSPASTTSETQNASAAARMDEEIVQDPFGALNLAARGRDAREVPAPPLVVQPAPPRLPIKATQAATAPVPELPAPPPPAPVAPPLPFTPLGGMQSPQLANGAPAAFLKQGEDILVVRPGDEINGTYKVEAITPERVVLTYLPLKQQQILSLRP